MTMPSIPLNKDARPALTDKEKKQRQSLKDDFLSYTRVALKIRSKAGSIELFKLNRAQTYLHECIEAQKLKTGRVRVVVLKGRQQGISTYVQGRFYWQISHRRGVRAYILSHANTASRHLLEMTHHFHNHCPVRLRPHKGAGNGMGLNFDRIDSAYQVGTARSLGAGRSSTLHYFHGSEVAFWPQADEHARGVLQAVPDLAGTEVILESTAGAYGNYYHQLWQQAVQGDSDFIAVFIPWFWQDEYRRSITDGFEPTAEECELKENHGLDDEQLLWRRCRIEALSIGGFDGRLAFAQEYPATPHEAFQDRDGESFISAKVVDSARRRGRKQDMDDALSHSVAPLVIGVDPARFGPDRTAIIRRRGELVYGLTCYQHLDTMAVAGLVAKIVETENPARIFVDVVGLGAGVVDRLNELLSPGMVVAVNGAEQADLDQRYVNKRAEIWGEMKAWLSNDDSVIPDDEALQAELCGLRYDFDSRARLRLEKKTNARSRGLRSPDCADALALTFAAAVAPMDEKSIYQNKDHSFRRAMSWMD